MLDPADQLSEETERRRAARASVMLRGTVEQVGVATAVRMVNISKTGMSLIGDLPPRHSAVTLHRNGLALRTRVAWSANGRGGIRFEDEVDVARLLRTIPAAIRRYVHVYGRARLRPDPLSKAERDVLVRCANLKGIQLPD